MLLPEVIDDYITAENPVRFIDAFVEGLNLEELGFKNAITKTTGRPPYNPSDLLRLYIYGYLNRIRSSRLLEKEIHRNLEVIWLMKKLRPDFKTIADFRKENVKAFKKVFRQFTILCHDLGMLSIPNEYIDAARIDGASEIGIFIRIILPLCKPPLATLGIFVFLTMWDDFLWPLIIISEDKYKTLPLGIASFESIYRTAYNNLMAIALLALIPIMVAFVFLQRRIVESVAMSGLKQ